MAFEISHQLEADGVAHALIDTDELDRIHPSPPRDPDRRNLTSRNLAAVWANLRDAGAPRLLLVGVMADLEHELSFVRHAVPGVDLTVVRLLASQEELLDRIRRREIGSRAAAQAGRSMEQARSMDRGGDGATFEIDTSGMSVKEIATQILRESKWAD